MKYINARKLKAEIERLREANRRAFLSDHINADIFHCRAQVINHFFEFITSLQQEQPKVDLETEIEEYINNFFYAEPSTADFPPEDIAYTMWKEDIRTFAHHFYELGLNARKEE